MNFADVRFNKTQWDQIKQTCDHNQNNIEICSTQQAETNRKLLYTKTDFLKCMCW